VPLSACALLSSKSAECATPQTQSQCDKMSMYESGAQVVKAADTSCCFLSGAPIPQSQHKASQLSTKVVSAGLDRTIDSPCIRAACPVPVAQSPSPPSFQSLHCTFLI
jgi:hypothetical protein